MLTLETQPQMIGFSKVQHGVPPDSLTRLKPHKLGRHYHKVPEHIVEVANKYPRLICDYFLRYFRTHLTQRTVTVGETIDSPPDCVFRSPLGRVGFSIARPLLTEVLEGYYGGVGMFSDETAPISSSEQRIRERLGRDVAAIFGRALLKGTDLGSLEPHENAYDLPEWDYQIHFAFEDRTSFLRLYLDHQIGDLLTSKMAATATSAQAADPLESIKRLPVRMDCIIASLEMSLGEVLALQPGDIMMIRMQERCDVRIAQQRFFRGAVFEQDGALCLTSLESVKSS